MYQTKPQNQPASVGGALSFGVQALPKHFMALYPAVFMAQGIPPILFAFLPKELVIGQLLLSQILVTLFMAGLITIANAVAERQNPEFSLVFSKMGIFLKMFAALWLVGAAVIIGMIFLVVPGIYLSLRLAFAPYFVALDNAGPIEACKMSWEMTDQHVLQLLGFYAAIFAISAIPVGIISAVLVMVVGRSIGQVASGLIVPAVSAYSILCITAMFRMLKGESVATEG